MFEKHIIDNDLQSPYWVYVADREGDQDFDLVTASGDGIEWWLNNDGSGEFVQKVLDNDMRNAHSVFAADLDMDGRVDGIGTGIGGTRWYRNKGDGTFTTETINDIGRWRVCRHRR